MKRWIMVLVVMLLLPVVVFAQTENDRILYEYDENTYLDINDLGFRFYYPAGWVYGTGNGIAIAENQADLAAHLNADDSIQPEGVVITIVGFPVEQITAEENPNIDETVDLILDGAPLEISERFDSTVMTHRAISVYGLNNQNGRYGIATIWMSDKFVILMSIGSPEEDMTMNLAYSWGVMLGMIEPRNALALVETPLEIEGPGFSVRFPDGWTPDTANPLLAYELEADSSSGEPPKGLAVGVLNQSLEAIGLAEDATIDEVIESAQSILSFKESAKRSESVVLDVPAITLHGESDDESGLWGIATVFIVNNHAVILVGSAPTEKALAAFNPTWIAILRSIRAIEA